MSGPEEQRALSPEEVARLQQIEQLKPKRGCFFLAVPILAIPGVFLAYGYLIYHGMLGRAADGPVTAMTYSTCSEAMPLLRSRVAQMGLPEATFTEAEQGFVITARLPQAVSETVPYTLAMPGRFEVRDDAGNQVVGPKAVESAAPRLDMTATPSAAVVINRPAAERLRAHMEAQPHGTISFFIDDERVDGRRNLASLDSRELEVTPHHDSPRDNMELAAAWSIIVNHGPLPCATRLLSSETVE